jgi:pimeloyl-ACP methyl ester carboxylesterase
VDLKVNYQVPKEQPDRDSQKILLMVHGAGGSSRHWQPLLDRLGEEIFSIALDLPGHGASSGVALDSIAEVADFLNDFLNQLGIDRPICYVGQSLGGLIGLQFALSYPERVESLVLMATAAKITLHPDFLASALSGKWDLATLSQSFASEVPKQVRDLVLNEFEQTRLPKDATDFMGVSRIDLSEAIASLTMPTLILVGDDDVIISPRKAKLLQKQIPEAHLVTIPGAGHYLQVEQPTKVAEEIEKFLNIRYVSTKHFYRSQMAESNRKWG